MQEDTKQGRQRHKSASEVNGTTESKLRKRTASSSSGFHFNANNNDSKKKVGWKSSVTRIRSYKLFFQRKLRYSKF